MKKSAFNILFGLLSIIALPSGAQTMRAMQAYDTIQHARDKANDLYEKKNASPAEIADGIKILYNALRFLDSTPVYELAQGNIYLKGRWLNIYLDLAEAYTIAGRKDSAIAYFEKAFAQGGYSNMLEQIQKDSTYRHLITDQRFTTLASKMKRQDELYQGTAFKTPYKPELTEDEKIAGLSLLWAQAKNNFVYFDHVNIDWNQSYLDYLPKVKAAKTTAEYYKVLERFYAQLKDGHTNVYFPKELRKEFYSRPPIRTELVEGRVFITDVYSDSLKKEGIIPGMEILKIDSEPVIAYADKNVAPYASSSTPQDMEVREFWYGLLAGPETKPVVLELKDRKGKIFTKAIARTGYHDVKRRPSMEYEEIGNIGCLTINNFEDYKITKQFDSLFTAISKTKGLIIDIRDNGGGSSDIGYHIIQKLTDKPFKSSAQKRLKYISSPGREVAWQEELPQDVDPDGKQYYSKPVILLVGACTFSAAEDFAEAFDYIKRGKLVGQPTGGSTGQPVSFDLPGGGTARVCGKRDTYPDGKEFVGIGIIPDIVITPTIKDLLNGSDAAKNKAIELLNGR